MDEKQKEGFRELEKSGYLKQVREFAMARCVPFFWSTQEAGQPPRLLHNGTICYVDTGQRQIAITNNHVYQQYIDDLANFPNVEAQFNGNTIEPETRLIDRNKDLDLATLDVPAIFVSSSTRNLLHHKPVLSGLSRLMGASPKRSDAAFRTFVARWYPWRLEPRGSVFRQKRGTQALYDSFRTGFAHDLGLLLDTDAIDHRGRVRSKFRISGRRLGVTKQPSMSAIALNELDDVTVEADLARAHGDRRR